MPTIVESEREKKNSVLSSDLRKRENERMEDATL
jgi:hypothetical protein